MNENSFSALIQSNFSGPPGPHGGKGLTAPAEKELRGGGGRVKGHRGRRTGSTREPRTCGVGSDWSIHSLRMGLTQVLADSISNKSCEGGTLLPISWAGEW